MASLPIEEISVLTLIGAKVLVFQNHCSCPKIWFIQSYAIIICLHIMLAVFPCVLVYVEDLLIIGNSLLAVNNFKASLSSTFHMKDLGILECFLGIEVTRLPLSLSCPKECMP